MREVVQVENVKFIEVHPEVWVCSGPGEAGTDRIAWRNPHVPGRLGPGPEQDTKKEAAILLEGWLAGTWRGRIHAEGAS